LVDYSLLWPWTGCHGAKIGEKMFKLLWTYFMLAAFTALISGCSPDVYLSPDSKLLHGQNTVPEYVSVYHIGVDDNLKINVWRNPELSVTVPVRPDGKISMPLIGDVKVAGYSPEEVSEQIRKQLKNFVRDPNVTLMVIGLKSNEYLTRLRITGAVKSPSSLNYRQGMTILDAVLAAGGVNDFASPNGTKLYRKISGKIHVVSINLGDILFKGRLNTNIELRPGDIITVPERLF